MLRNIPNRCPSSAWAELWMCLLHHFPRRASLGCSPGKCGPKASDISYFGVACPSFARPFHGHRQSLYVCLFVFLFFLFGRPLSTKCPRTGLRSELTVLCFAQPVLFFDPDPFQGPARRGPRKAGIDRQIRGRICVLISQIGPVDQA